MKKKQALGTVFHFQCVCFIQQKKNLQEENMISKYSVKRPYTVLVAVVLVIVLGAVSLSKMTTDLLPDMSFQYALVITTDMGASPEQVERPTLKISVLFPITVIPS